jgi:hypothetical protein
MPDMEELLIFSTTQLHTKQIDLHDEKSRSRVTSLPTLEENDPEPPKEDIPIPHNDRYARHG